MPQDGPFRPGPALVVIAVAVAVSLWAAWQATWPDPVLPRTALHALFVASLIPAAFLTVVGAFTGAYLAWRARVEEMGRRGGSALFLIGTGAGVLVLGLTMGGAAALAGEAASGFFLAAGLGVVAAGLAAVALSGATAFPRTTLTVSAGLTGVAAFAFALHAVTLMVGGFAFIALLQAWTPEPGTHARDDAAQSVRH